VSGGGDSTAMSGPIRLAKEFGWRLTVAHFDHRLRGRDEAEADLAFVSDSRNRWAPVVTGVATGAAGADGGESVEQAARTCDTGSWVSSARRQAPPLWPWGTAG
jgi:tRNA(Ile)-lysidine synthase TilS/MesJ